MNPEEILARIERIEHLLTGEPAIPLDRRSLAELVRFTAFHVGVRSAEIYGSSRAAQIYRARLAAIWAARLALGMSFPVIGRCLGNRDHTTILTANRRAEELRTTDPAFHRLTERTLAFEMARQGDPE